MSLRRALQALPDDRDTLSATRDVVGFFREHPGERLDSERIMRATGVSGARLRVILDALASGFVIDCGGESGAFECEYLPNPVVAMEIERFMRTSGGAGNRLQQGAERFRQRYGTER